MQAETVAGAGWNLNPFILCLGLFSLFIAIYFAKAFSEMLDELYER